MPTFTLQGWDVTCLHCSHFYRLLFCGLMSSGLMSGYSDVPMSIGIMSSALMFSGLTCMHVLYFVFLSIL